MEPVIVYCLLALLGCMFGSFAGAQVWRLRAHQLKDDDKRLEYLRHQKKLSEDDRAEISLLASEQAARTNERTRLDGLLVGVTKDYSRCLNCQHRLAWYDLLPLVSWLSTVGRCRYCKAPIGLFEPLMELGLAAAFVLSYALWPAAVTATLPLIIFILWLCALILLAILFAYDTKWFLLPDIIMFPAMGIGMVVSTLKIASTADPIAALISVVGAVVVLSGLYYVLWLVSKGQWIGFGDIKLGLVLALLLADWRLALLALFLANLIGCLVVIPGMLLGRIHRKAHVPFGPLMIVGAVIAMVVGERIISFYIAVAL